MRAAFLGENIDWFGSLGPISDGHHVARGEAPLGPLHLVDDVEAVAVFQNMDEPEKGRPLLDRCSVPFPRAAPAIWLRTPAGLCCTSSRSMSAFAREVPAGYSSLITLTSSPTES